MRILLIHSGADLYGASRSLLRLGRRLVVDGHTVLVVLPFDGPLRPELEKVDVPVLVDQHLAIVTRQGFSGTIGLLRLMWTIPRSLWRLSRIVRRFRPDLMHTNTAVVLTAGPAAKLTGTPHVWHMREFFTDFPGLWRWYRWFMRVFADIVICVSGPVAHQFDGARGSAKVVVCHNGFPRAEYDDVPEDRVRAFRHRFDVADRPAVGVVGRIKCGRKGQDVFVRAAAIVARDFPDAAFLLIGSPYPGNEDHLERVRSLVRELGLERHMVYTGDVDDVKAAYASLDISVLPSAEPEPFGGVVIESMALGIPVIGTRIGGTVEQIEHGVTGLLVEPNDPAAIAAAIGQLLSDPAMAREMGRRGRAHFLERFEFERFYRRIRELYVTLVAQ